MSKPRGFHLLIAVVLGLAVPVLCGAQVPLEPEFRVNPDPASGLINPRVAVNAGGEFVVLWYGFGDSSGGVLHARRFRSDGTAASGEIRVADRVVSTNENLEVALQDDGSFLALFSVPGALKLRRFAPDGTLLRDVRVIAGSPYVPGASLSSRGDRFVVAWRRFGEEVSARVYGPDATPVGPRITVEASNQPKYGPLVAMGPRGEFVVVWQRLLGADPASGRLLANIEARRYGPGSHPRGEKVLVSDHFGAGIHVAKDATGSFLVTWIELPTVSGVHGIYGRRFSPAGTPLALAMPLVPSFTTGYTDLAMSPDGVFVLTWEGLPEVGVAAQVFAIDGVAPRPAFRVSESAAGGQLIPRVAIDSEGKFVVVWQRGNILGRRFRALQP
jgi:hypothetical protein